MKTIAIIGAGPAGIFTALSLKNFDGKIVLFDQNKRIGEKLRITGGGRMNVTNKIFSEKEFSSETPRALKHLFKSPWVKNRETLLQSFGVEYVWEKNRAILKSGDANKEVNRLAQMIVTQPNVEFQGNSKVISVEKKEERFCVRFTQEEDAKTSMFDAVVLSGGAMFRMFSREKKDGIYALPKQLGHKITNTAPSLSPIRISNNPFKELSGTAMELQLSVPATKIRMTQEALFTHMGISGPVVLDFSAYLPESGNFEINFLPQISEELFLQQIQALRSGKNLLRNFLRNFMPKKVVDWHLEQLELEKTIHVSDVSKDTLKRLRKNLFRFVITNAKTFDYPACWTTRGGVSLTDVNVATLESKLQKNLFFAGEILDVNGLCGGYNISFAAISAKIVSENLLQI
ncbi:hypothetical protein CSB37_02985 [bacterium DOLZORAL124_38_8]|nr:MAG: hypothetical protein CSB37_02985 [bacterium DOLZORAL124_38_8]